MPTLFAVDNHADVINLSLGLREKSSLLADAVNYAFAKGVPIAAAAGNYNTNKQYYPAAYDNVIAVAGLAKDGAKLPQSNFGTWVDYSVVAQDILSDAPGNKYAYATGTSQAVAFVSAKIARILERTKNADVKAVLAATKTYDTGAIIAGLNKVSVSTTFTTTGKFAHLLGMELR